jgi:transmembrane sensor
MTDSLVPDIKTDIISEACAWIVQIEEGNLTQADQAAFEEWISSSPVHKAEIKRLANLSGSINILTDMRPSLDEAVKRRRKMRSSGVKRKLVMSFVMASAIMVFTVFTGVFSGDQNTDNPLTISESPVLYVTKVGGKRVIDLSDGSVLTLNTKTEIEVDYTSNRRKVRLIKGEAFFQVAHNPDRPFLVYAGNNIVRAVGTAFIVRNFDKKFEVTVTEGLVELNTKPSKQLVSITKPSKSGSNQDVNSRLLPQTLAISAGETITYTASVQVNKVEKITVREIERELSWQDGLLEFSETPLSEVIEDLSRYTALKIEITDPDLRDLKFGGLFRTDELSVLFATLETNFDIEVDYEGDDVVKISHSKNKQ